MIKYRTKAELLKVVYAAERAERAFSAHYNAESESEQGAAYEKLVDAMLKLRKALR